MSLAADLALATLFVEEHSGEVLGLRRVSDVEETSEMLKAPASLRRSVYFMC